MNFKRNFMFNSLLTASGYVFTLLTYPYISRVHGLSNVGIVNFVDGLINYFILFAMMGVGTVGIREVAINKNDRNELSKTFSGVITLNTISTLCVLTVIVNGLVNIVYCRKFISKNLHTIIFI